MPMVDLNLDGDGSWPDLQDKQDRIIHLREETPLRVAALDQGTQLGLPSLALRIDLPDGRIVIYETTARMWTGIAKALRARWPML